jgi:hypothetical protein
MKNKGLTYVLLIVVGIIWYNVFFRIKDNLMTEDSPVVPSLQQKQSIISLTRDTFELHANYRDPFRSSKKEASVSTEQIPQPTQPIIHLPKVVEPPKPRRWPKMKYYGIVKNQHAKSPLCIISIDNMLFNLREGEEAYDRIVVKKIYGDSVLIVQEKHKRILKK